MRYTVLKETALAYQKQGLSIMPIGKNKTTNLIKWGDLQKTPASREDILKWPWARTHGLALLTGFVSGNVEALDFDFKNEFTKEEYLAFQDKVYEKFPNINVLIQKTPSANYLGDTGRHWLYTCKKIGRNAKLAFRVPESKEGKDMVVIETRGEGGILYIAPTEGYEFKNANGEGLVIPEITEEQRDYLMEVALSFDHTGAGEISNPVGKTRKGKMKFVRKEVPVFPKAYLDYNVDHASRFLELLSEDGWETSSSGQEEGKKLIRLLRPGKAEGNSGTFYPGDNTFYNFSSSVGLPTHQMMNLAEYLCHRDHDGKEKKMLKWLLDEGYSNKERERKLKTKLKQDTKVRRHIEDVADAVYQVFNTRYNTIRRCVEYKDVKCSYGEAWSPLGKHDVNIGLRKHGIVVTKEILGDLVKVRGMFKETNPVIEWLDSLHWDGKPQLETLARHVTCKDHKRWMIMFKKHLIRCVRQLRMEGTNREALFLQQSEQRSGKTRFIRFVTQAGPMRYYYTEHIPSANKGGDNIESRLLCMHAHINVEELDAFRKADMDRLKAFTSADDATFREFFTNLQYPIPRIANFWGSTNKANFLTDDQNTRWIVNEVENIDWSYTKIDINQVWAEAASLYAAGAACDLTVEELEANEEVTDDYRKEPIDREWVFECFVVCGRLDEDVVFMNATSIYNDLLMYYTTNQAVTRAFNHVPVSVFGAIFKGLGFEYDRLRNRGVQQKGFFVKTTEIFEKSKNYVDSFFLRRKNEGW